MSGSIVLFDMFVNCITGHAKPPCNEAHVLPCFKPSSLDTDTAFGADRRVSAFRAGGGARPRNDGRAL